MIVGWIMHLSPYGIAALLLQLVATQDAALLMSVGHFIAVVIGSTLFHGIVVLPGILWFMTGMSPWRFFKGAREALITAFAHDAGLVQGIQMLRHIGLCGVDLGQQVADIFFTITQTIDDLQAHGR